MGISKYSYSKPREKGTKKKEARHTTYLPQPPDIYTYIPWYMDKFCDLLG